MTNLNQLQIEAIIQIALEAGKIAMKYFGQNNLNITNKTDNSPLTIADCLISEIINAKLKNISPATPIICEEGKNRDFGDGTFWLIDPIDGTSSFITNNKEFTINIALIKDKNPIFGLIFAPAIKDKPLYYTNQDKVLMKYCPNKKEHLEVIFDKRIRDNFIIISSRRSSDNEILECYKNLQLKIPDIYIHNNQKPIVIHKLSSSLKFIYLIENKADFYLHLRKSMEWDTAAGQAILEAFKGKVANLDGSNFLYTKDQFINQPFFALV